MKHLPNIFTLLNLFLGCMAIVFALQTDSVIIYMNDDFSSSFNIPESLTLASICVGLAGVVDFLDGFVARLLKATSPLGGQLDSLSDVVSFGVVPGVILYQFIRFSYAKEENGLDIPIALLLPAFLVTCAAAYRLAKFNLDAQQHYHFKGVPTPAVGLLVASFPLIMHFNSQLFGAGNILTNKWVLYGLIIVLSYLMVSNIPIMAMKFKDYTLKSNIPKVILLIVAIVAALVFKWFAVPVVFLAYILLSLANKNNLQ
ncbi:MAG: CDP-alcohol phosphatidyltransferase family protein [Ginsengibacter sp.]